MHHFVCSALCVCLCWWKDECVCVYVCVRHRLLAILMVCVFILGYHALLLLAERINECSIIFRYFLSYSITSGMVSQMVTFEWLHEWYRRWNLITLFEKRKKIWNVLYLTRIDKFIVTKISVTHVGLNIYCFLYAVKTLNSPLRIFSDRDY